MQSFLGQDKLKITRIAAFIAFIIPMLLTRQLWFSDRFFPLIPLFDFSFSNIYLDVFLITAFIGSFIFFTQNPSWKYGLPVILIYSTWALLDQNRIQNFFFEIIYVVLAITLFSKNKKLAKECLLLVFVGTYFFSGIHKYNDVFFEKWMNGLSKRIPFVPYELRWLFTKAIPFIEASFGIGLLFYKTRKTAIILLGLMHTIILLTLLMGGYGFTVFPLNIFNVFVLYYVFYNDREINYSSVFKINGIKKLLMLLLVIILPLFNFFGKYDHILSFSYLTGKPKYARLYFDKNEKIDELPISISQSVRKYNNINYIDFNEWAGKSIRVLVYPEKRVYSKIQNHIEFYAKKPTKLELY